MKTRRIVVLAAAILAAGVTRALFDCDDIADLHERVAGSSQIAVVRIESFDWDQSILARMGPVSGTSQNWIAGAVFVEATVKQVLKGPPASSLRFHAYHGLPAFAGCGSPFFERGREAIVFLRGSSSSETLEMFGGNWGLHYLPAAPDIRQESLRSIVDEIRAQHGPG